MIGVVSPTRTDAYARRLLRSLAACEPELNLGAYRPGDSWPRLVFAENGMSADAVVEIDSMWSVDVVTPGPIAVDPTTPGSVVYPPFVFARSVNVAVSQLDPRADVLIVNDDAAFCSPRPIAALEALLEEKVDAERRVRDLFGVVGLRVEGGVGNPDQAAPVGAAQILETDKAICFVAALVPRGAWDAIGPLDERFVGYGMDDVDYCRRAIEAGYRIGVTGAAAVRHVGNPDAGEMHGSYSRLGRDEHTRLYLVNQRLYAEKWGDAGRGAVRGER